MKPKLLSRRSKIRAGGLLDMLYTPQELAEELLVKSVTAADQKRLIDEYMQKVGELH